jgi:immune inhibitor A
MKLGCRCLNDESRNSYADGPTSCIAHPKVMASIKKEVAKRGILSAADARLATLTGMLKMPPVGRTGFNDGVIYDLGDDGESDGPALSKKASATPLKSFSLQKSPGKETLKCLVLLVDFSDNQGSTAPSHFEKLLFDPTNPGSMRSFYNELSFGRLDIEGTVTNWIRAANPYNYYTNGESGTARNFPRNTPGLLDEVLRAYGATNSLLPFDGNSDGYVDGLFLIHAGSGAEAELNETNRANMIWSHKWVLPTAYVNSGVKAFAYFTAPEDGRLGVFAHEFGHFIGLPDLYDTSSRSYGIGNWCLMAGGSWNGDGDQPARLSAWCLSRLGWSTPVNVTSSGKLNLPAHETTKNGSYRLWKGGKASKEYFLVENRQKAGRDGKLPGSGLAIWHIDETQSDNTNPNSYMVSLIQADGQRHLERAKNGGDASDLFPGSKEVKKVDDQGSTHPHLRKNDGTSSGVAVSNITEHEGVITVTVKV